MLEYRRVPISKYSIGDICPNLRNKNPISPSTNTATTNRATYYKRSYSSYSSSQQSKPKLYNSFELHEQKVSIAFTLCYNSLEQLLSSIFKKTRKSLRLFYRFFVYILIVKYIKF